MAPAAKKYARDAVWKLYGDAPKAVAAYANTTYSYIVWPANTKSAYRFFRRYYS